MSLWIVLVAMAGAAAAVLLWPLARRAGAPAARARYDLAVYRDQLAEIAREEAEGALPAGQAAAARLEIERRILAAGAKAADGPAGSHRAEKRRVPIILLAILGPLAALALYYERGAPDLPGQPFAARADKIPAVAELDRLVAQLARRLESEPANLEGWTLLARSFAALRRYEAAADAFAHAASLSPNDAALRSAQGEALTRASDGIVTPAARTAFESALALDAKDPRARFYLGLHRLQEGDAREALSQWEALAAESPPDSPWLPELERRIADLRESIANDRD